MPSVHLVDPVTSVQSLSEAQGKGSAVSVDPLEKLRLLDDPQEWSAFSRPDAAHAGCWESNLIIEGMHCAACALTIEDVLLGVPGVIRAEVSAGSHRARIVWSEVSVKPSGWMKVVQNAGYRALPANDSLARERRAAEASKALWRLLVAGLCMMQVMMYAWPAYVAEPGDLSGEMEQLLRWASWVLTLPVIFFSCGPFFGSALRDILNRRVSMDLPVALGMLITFVVSSIGTFEPHGNFGREVYFDSLTMFVFFLLGGRWFELRLRNRTAGALEALMNRLPDSVARQLPDGAYELVPVRRLVPEDVIRILPGEAFPADGMVMQGDTLVDEALLTGESRPVAKVVGAPVIAGSHNLASVVHVRVERVGEQTRFAQIVALMEAVAVLIVTCPCALSLATPTAMLAAAGTLARSGVLVRRLDAFEALAGIDTVMFDKTGTLTRDAMVLGDTRVRESFSPEKALAMAAALARQSLHPVSRAIVAASGGANDSPSQWVATNVAEVAGGGVSGQVAHGAVGRGVFNLRLGSAEFCGVVSPPADTLQACLSDQNGWLATFELHEDVRPDASSTIASLRQANMSVHLLSGDGAQAAARVASQVGVTEFQGDCTPQDKLAFLQGAQASGHKVAVVGDGLNDGPVLAGAHVSFAFGQAVPLAQARADFVVLGNQLGAVVKSWHLARRTLRIVRQNLWWAAIYNAACVPLAVAGWLPAWLAGLGMAASSLLVVLNSLRLSAQVSLDDGS